MQATQRQHVQVFSQTPSNRHAADVARSVVLLAESRWFNACFAPLRIPPTTPTCHAEDLASLLTCAARTPSATRSSDACALHSRAASRGVPAPQSAPPRCLGALLQRFLALPPGRGATRRCAPAPSSPSCSPPPPLKPATRRRRGRRYHKCLYQNDELRSKGGALDRFFVVLSGSVTVSDAKAPPKGGPRQEGVTLLGPGDWFGHEALLPEPDAQGHEAAQGRDEAPGAAWLTAAQGASGVRPTARAVGSQGTEVLCLTRADHLHVLGRMRRRRLMQHVDVLARVPMFQHYSCVQRMALAAASTLLTVSTDAILVPEACR